VLQGAQTCRNRSPARAKHLDDVACHCLIVQRCQRWVVCTESAIIEFHRQGGSIGNLTADRLPVFVRAAQIVHVNCQIGMCVRDGVRQKMDRQECAIRELVALRT
jgi:hypothetical protein